MSSFADPSSLRPNLKPESLQLGSALGGPEAEGGSGGPELASDRPGTRADPGRTSPDLSFLGTKGESSPRRLAPASSSSGMERRERDLRGGKDSPDS